MSFMYLSARVEAVILFMGSPFGFELWNLNSRPAGLPTQNKHGT